MNAKYAMYVGFGALMVAAAGCSASESSPKLFDSPEESGGETGERRTTGGASSGRAAVGQDAGAATTSATGGTTSTTVNTGGTTSTTVTTGGTTSTTVNTGGTTSTTVTTGGTRSTTVNTGGTTSTTVTTGGRATGGTASTTGGTTSTTVTTGGRATGGTTVTTGGTTVTTGGRATGGTTVTTGGTATGGTASTTGGTATGGTASATGGTTSSGTLFSFFQTSCEAMQALSGNALGFGGDLRYGEATGIAGADKICQTIAADEGFGDKTWRAFLSTTTEDAIDRVGTGPWYDRLGRLVASNLAGLAPANRPAGDSAVVNDLPNEKGVQEHTANSSVDDHDTLTGSNTQGRLYSTSLGSTCNDWTSAVGSTGRPMAGHAWPGGPSQHWIQAHTVPGCAPGVNLVNSSQSCSGGIAGVGCSGGCGAIYCLALTP